MLQGHNEARVRMSMETRGKENLRPRDSSGCGRSLAKILKKENAKSNIRIRLDDSSNHDV